MEVTREVTEEPLMKIARLSNYPQAVTEMTTMPPRISDPTQEDEALNDHGRFLMGNVEVGSRRHTRRDKKATGMLLHCYTDDLVFVLPDDVTL